MKKRIFNIIVIAFMAALLIALSALDLLEKSAKFMVVPFLCFYFLGQYAERKFKK